LRIFRQYSRGKAAKKIRKLYGVLKLLLDPRFTKDGDQEIQSNQEKPFDIAIVGAGVLGVCIAYWLSRASRNSIVLIDREERVAAHTSSRNTGVVHRPFYLNPEKKKLFASAAEKSYYLWSDLARTFHLSWSEIGTLEVAVDESQVKTLHQYRDWAIRNGMEESEVEVLDPSQVTELEPLVRCDGAIYSKRDTSVQYGDMTECVFKMVQKAGVKFFGGCKLINVREDSGGVNLDLQGKSGTTSTISSKFMINTAGGSSLDITHSLGFAKDYTDLHFRGEYWTVEPNFGKKIKRNIYSVARHKEFPFLDPHFIVRADGRREVGPNAVLVSGPYVYKGLSNSESSLLKKIFEWPNRPKLKLFTNPRFLSLVWQEWRSSLSKSQMCKRVSQFIPSLNVVLLKGRGLSGVRSSVIDKDGFVSEAVLIQGRASLHVLNYNSPGATGAPSYSAYIVRKIFQDGLITRGNPSLDTSDQMPSWDFDKASTFQN
jgi:(S)-2-hydroxyglutarate dehydrogenase